MVVSGDNIPLFLDPDIYQYKNLRSLTINNANIVKIPDRFNELQLEYLDLSHNKIGTLGYTICEIKTLKELNVSYNNIACLNDIFNNLKGLVHFDISHNKLKKIAEVRFLDFINLKSADFSNNCLEAIQSTIFKLGSLEKVKFNNNQIRSIPKFNSVGEALNFVDISCNFITELPLAMKCSKKFNSSKLISHTNPFHNENNLENSDNTSKNEELFSKRVSN